MDTVDGCDIATIQKRGENKKGGAARPFFPERSELSHDPDAQLLRQACLLVSYRMISISLV